MNVRDLLAERAAGSPDRPAFIEGATGRTLTWAGIQARPAPEPDPGAAAVRLCSFDPLENAATFLAALAASVPVVPLDPAAAAAPAVQPTAPPGAAVVMASSGTTGRPKVIPLTEAQLLHTSRAIVDHHRFGPDDRGYCPLPLFQINGLVVGVLSTLVAGSTLVVDARFSRRAFWSTVAAHHVTWVNAVPAIIAILSTAPPPDPEVAGRIRFVRSASAPLAPAVRARFEVHCGIGILETYGMTEAASQITANPLDPSARPAGSVGRPVDIELRVVGADRRPIPAGEVGEVEIRGPAVATPPGAWLATSDLGRVDADGFLYLAGRADDVINRGGEKVYPADVEAVLLADPRVAAAAVVGQAHPVFGDEPVAFVVPERPTVDRPRLADELTFRCRSTLSRCKVPARITVVDALPAGPTGKVRRRDVRRTLVQRSSS